MYSSQPGQLIFPDQGRYLQQPAQQDTFQQQRSAAQPMQVPPFTQDTSSSSWAPGNSAAARLPQPPFILKDDQDYSLLDDEDDDDLNNIDTSNMTQEEKNNLKQQRKQRKMNREKLKRAKLNNQFDHLCQILAMGRSTRVEKLAVLNETIRTVCKLKAENDGLRMQKERIKIEIERRRADAFSTPEPQQLQQEPAAMEISNTVPAYEQYPPQMKHPPGKQNLGMKFGFDQSAAPAQPEDNDLDFAFGDSCDNFWEAEQEPWHQQWPIQAPAVGNNLLDFKGFPACAQPEDDSVDMFLDNGDSSDLLCL